MQPDHAFSFSDTVPQDGADWPGLGEQERRFGMVAAGAVFEADTLLTDDGVHLRVLRAGPARGPAVVLVNALGVSGLFMARLAQVLAPHWRVLSWESRGLPDMSASPVDVDLSVARHARDLQALLAQEGVRPAAIVSYCSGTNVAAYGLAQGLFSTDAWCVVSPSVNVPAAGQTDYQRTMLPLWRKVSQGDARQAGLVRVLLGGGKPPPAAPEDLTLAQQLLHLNGLPFVSNATTHRYACMQAACLEPDWASLLRAITVPTLVCHGAVDDTIHHDTASGVAAQLPGATLVDIPEGGHFAIYDSAHLHETILAFLRGLIQRTQAKE